LKHHGIGAVCEDIALPAIEEIPDGVLVGGIACPVLVDDIIIVANCNMRAHALNVG
jgi:hypothetical protein